MTPETLESVPLPASPPRRRRRKLTRCADEIDAPPGYVLTKQGGCAQEFFIVAHGTADVFRNGDHVGEIEAGDFFGETGQLGSQWERTSPVVAAPMRLLVLARPQLQELLATAPELDAPIVRAAAERTTGRAVIRSTP